ncbi:DUF4065 domain-containing protein [Legionella pneumophila]|uniref:Panacea domain-containing protein n=1 Tax=Legionella pneumophila TaxID=446 RepID=UPI0009B14931|nr:type II toxin-antitoxin system antitoxin SocA domain-containing protein [Legionella pneumophila]HAT9855562.1 DUF4065 domain-containing protein [Legionella pneumophila subsp. pneumophila]RYW86792.1 DUF4065 domain-containing protein [Legionella pneumophila]STX97641.1 Uncharacterized phage-associated protein [Legionella pneumophila]HAT8674872.1 DUF4065 domain-containing protein [Legionella pneumophila]HAU1022683.1 DUF4065 domain-containing protein [Legionella pneumophila]
MNILTERTKPYSSIAVANKILDLARDRGIDISHLKLQKLVYLAHAIYLAIKKKPLIKEPIEAWKYGPVINKLYSICSKYGRKPIEEPIIDFDWGDDSLMEIKREINSEDNDVIDLLEAVLTKYGKLTPGQLTALTHEQNSAWGVTEKYHDSGNKLDYEIPIELIGEVEGEHLLAPDYWAKVRNNNG